MPWVERFNVPDSKTQTAGIKVIKLAALAAGLNSEPQNNELGYYRFKLKRQSEAKPQIFNRQSSIFNSGLGYNFPTLPNFVGLIMGTSSLRSITRMVFHFPPRNRK